MRYIITTLLTFMVTTVLNAQTFIDNRNDLQKQELKGRVKSIKSYKVKQVDYMTQEELTEFKRQGQKPPYFKREWDNTIEFNENGFITKSRAPESWTGDCYDNKYAPDGRLEAVISYNDDGSVRNVYSFEYDKRGFITTAIRKSQNEVFFKESYTCDDSGRILYMMHDYLDGRIQKASFEYMCGKISKWIITLNDEPAQTFIFDGDAAHPIECYNWQRGVCTHMLINYNNKNLPITISTETYSGKWYVSTLRSFDEYGNVIDEKNFTEDGNINNAKSFQYEYDAQGNWTRKVVKGSRKVDNIIQEREIEYY